MEFYRIIMKKVKMKQHPDPSGKKITQKDARSPSKTNKRTIVVRPVLFDPFSSTIFDLLPKPDSVGFFTFQHLHCCQTKLF